MGRVSQPALTLVSHALCPYVQRAAIVLAEKGASFERRDVDLTHKPAWFLAVSPLGRTPVLLVGDGADAVPIFESAVICEYLDDTLTPRLHPADALDRARHRAWMEFGSATLNSIAGFYAAAEDTTLERKRGELRGRFEQLEAQLQTRQYSGFFFAGERFCMVDAVFAPVFRYFDSFERIANFHFFDELPGVQDWRARLADRQSVRHAVAADYPQLLLQFLRTRGSALSRHMATAS
jgi:glutathione S-transferase